MKKLAPKAGRVLISDPFLKDPNFSRTVVFLTDYSDEGAMGFVLNNPLGIRLRNLLKDESLPNVGIFQGGPVELNTMHFIHSLGQIIPETIQIKSGVWWGGIFEETLKLLRRNEELIEHFQFFLGYSGWGSGQLEEELKEDAWLVSEITSGQLFNRKPGDKALWKELIEGLGGDYRYLSNSPIDPQLN